MDHLLKRKKEIQHLLNNLQKKENLQTNLKTEIENKQNTLLVTKSKLKTLKLDLKTKEKTILLLKEKIENFKESKIIEVKNKLMNIQDKINNFKFKENINVFNDFKTINYFLDEYKLFVNVNQKIKKMFLNAKKQLKEKLINYLIRNIFNFKKMHEFLYGLHILVKYEFTFDETIFYDFIFQKLNNDYSKRFENHRLDKPEWIFDYLIDEIKKYKTYIIFYNNIKNKYYRERDNLNNQIYDKNNGSIHYNDGDDYEKDINLENKIIDKKDINNNEMINNNKIIDKKEINNKIINNNEMIDKKEITDNKMIDNKNINNKIINNNEMINNNKMIDNKNINNNFINNINQCEKEFMKIITSLINTNFNEIISSSSSQKRNLIIHFCDELRNFKTKLNAISDSEYLNSTMIKETLKTIEKERIHEKICLIFSEPFDTWFVDLNKIIDETVSFGISMIEIDDKLLSESVYCFCLELDNFFDIFIERFVFRCDEEKNMICCIFWGIEELKNLLIEKEIQVSEIMQKMKNKKFAKVNIPNLVSGEITDKKFLNNENFYRKDINFNENFNKKNINFNDNFNQKDINFNITPLINRNRMNYSLIKNLINHETENLLRQLGNFKFITEKTIVDVIIKFGKMQEIYGKYFNQSIFKDAIKMINEKLIDLIFEKLESERFLRIKEFYEDVSNVFGSFEVKIYIECVEDLFEGKNRDDEIFLKLKNIYLEN
ncbi:hypothetical protein DMUE_3710 [Dictyocoela muelleri]|nr:hypothetical protein DMUE_3710 [Dictyocoela muelleri]